VSRFLFGDEADFSRRLGIRTIASRGETGPHAAYLRRVGFRDARDGTFTLEL
jgi:hypothetical protein